MKRHKGKDGDSQASRQEENCLIWRKRERGKQIDTPIFGISRATHESKLYNTLALRTCFQFRIADDDHYSIRLNHPLEYRVYDESRQIVQQGKVEREGPIVVEADLSKRYALWVDGEFLTFHDEPPK